MNTKIDKQLPEIQEQAAQWLLLMMKEDGVQHNREFTRWLNHSPLHKQTYTELRQTWGLITEAAAEEEIETLYKEERISPVKKQPATSLFSKISTWMEPLQIRIAVPSLAMLALFTVAMMYQSNAKVFENQFDTGVGEIVTVTLSDGSLVTLGPKTLIETQFTQEKREVTLRRGEAFFDVVSQKERPFEVTAGEMIVEVVGTQFDVRKRANSHSVNVVEGLVNVKATGLKRDSNPLLLQAGESAKHLLGQQLQKVNSLPQSDFASWRTGRLVYVDQTLDDILSDANRYSKKQILLVDESLSKERITLSLNSAQIDNLPTLLSHILPIKYSEFSDDKVILSSI